MLSRPCALLTVVATAVTLTGCSFTGDSLKAPAAQSATTVTASPSLPAPSPSSSTADTRAEDPIVEPAGTATAGALAFCDVNSMHGNACTKPVSVFQGSRLGCATHVSKGSTIRLRILKDGVELVNKNGKFGAPGKDGKVAVSGDLRLDPASLPAGIYSCEFTVDKTKPVTGAVKVKGPQGSSGISQVRFCPEVKDKARKASTAACSSGANSVVAPTDHHVQCSAVVIGAKGQPMLVRITKGDRNFDFPFTAAQMNKNIGVMTASVRLNTSGDLRCEIQKNDKRVAARDFTLGVENG